MFKIVFFLKRGSLAKIRLSFFIIDWHDTTLVTNYRLFLGIQNPRRWLKFWDLPQQQPCAPYYSLQSLWYHRLYYNKGQSIVCCEWMVSITLTEFPSCSLEKTNTQKRNFSIDIHKIATFPMHKGLCNPSSKNMSIINIVYTQFLVIFLHRCVFNTKQAGYN